LPTRNYLIRTVKLCYAAQSCQFLGGHSLEIYLLHEKLLWFIDNLTRITLPAVYEQAAMKTVLNLSAILAAMVGAVVLKWICDKFKDKVTFRK
jgi:membrane-bound acyltransferase YfiQ involved in biofilm formation